MTSEGMEDRASSQDTAKAIAVKRATNATLVRYAKTFKDLGRYDRGEVSSI